MEKKFETIDELVENLSRGGEVEFMYHGKPYSITHTDEGISIMNAYNYDSEKIFQDPHMVSGYLMDGIPLSSVIQDAEVTFRCFE